MRLYLISLWSTLLTTSVAGPVVARSTPSFAGTSNYFLHGVSAAEREIYLSTLHSWGMKTVRLWGK